MFLPDKLGSIVHSELDSVRSHPVVLSHPPPVLGCYDLEEIVPAGLDGDVVAGSVSVDPLAHRVRVLRVLLGPALNLKIVNTLEVLNTTPAHSNSNIYKLVYYH